MSKKPTLQAMVLADRVYVDQASGKCVIAGTFNRIWSRRFPSTYSQLSYLYVCLTDVQGKVDIVVRLVNLSNNQIVMRSEGISVQHDDPLMSHELVLPIPGFPLPQPGSFGLELFANDENLGSKKLQFSEATT